MSRVGDFVELLILCCLGVEIEHRKMAMEDGVPEGRRLTSEVFNDEEACVLSLLSGATKSLLALAGYKVLRFRVVWAVQVSAWTVLPFFPFSICYSFDDLVL